jgi:hypothetical protein
MMKQTQREWLQAEISLKEPVSGYLIRRLVTPELSAACGITGARFDDSTYPMPSLSREQLFGMMSVTAPENALAMICGQRITSKEEAIAFLGRHNLEALLEDHSGSVAEAISRKADLSKFIDIIADERVALWRHAMECSWADLAEVYSSSLAGTDVDFRLSDGDNTWSYVKSIGISNIYRYGGELLGLEGKFTPREVKMLVARSELPMKNPAEKYPLTSTRRERLTALISISRRLGAEDTASLRVPGVFNLLKSALGHEPDAAACKFMDDFVFMSIDKEVDSRTWGYASAYAYHAEGISPEDAVAFIKDDISPERAAAIRDGRVSPSISSGWL